MPEYPLGRCSSCGAFDSLEAIERHNLRCANTGERVYPRPSLKQLRSEKPSPLSGADMLMAAFPPKFADRSGARAASTVAQMVPA